MELKKKIKEKACAFEARPFYFFSIVYLIAAARPLPFYVVRIDELQMKLNKKISLLIKKTDKITHIRFE